MASETSQAIQGIQIDVFGLTDVGRVRKNNQDYFALVDLSRKNQGTGPEVTSHLLGASGTLILVSDGMGGEAAGDVASRRSVETVVEEMSRWTRDSVQGEVGAAFAEALEDSVQKGNEVVSRESDENPAYRGMGATMTAVGVLDGELYVVQVGDSRCYLRADGKLRQITRDQSLVGQLLVEGRITKEEAERHPHRNIILQALGKSPTIQAEVLRVPLRRGDEILLCSDGLSGPVRDHDIEARLTVGGDLGEICRDLVQTANDHGGSDNITAVVARFLGDGLPAPKEGEDRTPVRLAEFSFTGEEEEEQTQETVVTPDQTAFLGEGDLQSIAEILSPLEPEPPPPPPALRQPLPAPPPEPAGVAVSGFAMMSVLAFSVAAGLALTRLLGPEPVSAIPPVSALPSLGPGPEATPPTAAAAPPATEVAPTEPAPTEPAPTERPSVEPPSLSPASTAPVDAAPALAPSPAGAQSSAGPSASPEASPASPAATP